MKKEMEELLEKYKGFPKTKSVIYDAYCLGFKEGMKVSNEAYAMEVAELKNILNITTNE